MTSSYPKHHLKSCFAENHLIFLKGSSLKFDIKLGKLNRFNLYVLLYKNVKKIAYSYQIHNMQKRLILSTFYCPKSYESTYNCRSDCIFTNLESCLCHIGLLLHRNNSRLCSQYADIQLNCFQFHCMTHSPLRNWQTLAQNLSTKSS